jgi:purine-binding chemotaxis protein CheW
MNNETIDTAKYDFGDGASKRVAPKLQLVSASSSQFGIFADKISTIVPWQEPTSLPHAPKSVLGVVSIEGRMLTVLDLALLPAEEGTQPDAARSATGYLVALRGDEQLALAVDAIGETIQFAPADFEGQQETESTLVLGILHVESAEIKVLNLKKLFPTAIQGRQRRQRRF